jgi:hypothetical protein
MLHHSEHAWPFAALKNKNINYLAAVDHIRAYRRLPVRGAWAWAIVAGGLLLLAIFVLGPLFQTGFTTRDDAEAGLLPDQYGGWWPAVWALTLASGRFFHLIWLNAVFALSRLCSTHPVGYHLLALGSVLLNIAGFYLVTARVFASKAAGILAAACALTWLQNGWNHNLLTSYPVVPHLGLTSLLAVVILLLEWQRSGRSGFAIGAGAVFFVALLLSETFVVYFPVLLAVCAFRAWQMPGREVGERARITVAGSLPMIAALAIYLGCYFMFRHAYPSHHQGNQLAPFDLGRIGAVIWQYTTSTFPSYFYFRDPVSVNVVFDWSRPEWLAKALIATLFCGLILVGAGRIFTVRSFAWSVLAGMACLIAPVLLVSLTPQYQDWVVDSGSLAYGAPSYYAYFAMVFLIVVVMLGLSQLLARWRLVWRLYVLLACCFVAGTSLATDYYNHSITLDQQLSHLKWKTVDRFISTDIFGAIPEGSIIYAPSLWRARGIMANSDNYWGGYFSRQSGKRVSVTRTAWEFQAALEKNPAQPAYFLKFEQEPREPNQFLVFAALKKPAETSEHGTAYADAFTLFTYSRNRKFTLIGNCVGRAPPVLEVNGQRLDGFDSNVFFAPIDHDPTTGDFPKAMVRSSVPVDLARLRLSYFPAEQPPKQVEVHYGPGFYGEERDPASGSSWNWSRARAELSVINNSSQQMERTIKFTLTSFTSRSVTLRMSGSKKVFALEANGSQAVGLRIVLEPGENKLVLESDQPARLIGNGDPRTIAFGVRDFVVTDPAQ